MKPVLFIIILGLAYGLYNLYEQGYFSSVQDSFGNTVNRTTNFVTDSDVKNTNF